MALYGPNGVQLGLPYTQGPESFSGAAMGIVASTRVSPLRMSPTIRRPSGVLDISQATGSPSSRRSNNSSTVGFTPNL